MKVAAAVLVLWSASTGKIPKDRSWKNAKGMMTKVVQSFFSIFFFNFVFQFFFILSSSFFYFIFRPFLISIIFFNFYFFSFIFYLFL